MMLLRVNRSVCKIIRVNDTLRTVTKSTSSDKTKNQNLIDALKNVPKRTGTKSTTSSDETKNQNLFEALKNVPKRTGTKNTTSSDEAKNQNLFDELKNVPKRTGTKNTMSSDETKKNHSFDAPKNVREKPDPSTYVYPRAELQVKKKLNREAAFKDNGFDKKKVCTKVSIRDCLLTTRTR